MDSNALISEGLRIAPFIALVSTRVVVAFALLPAPFGDLAPARIRAALSFIIAFAIALPTLGNAMSLPTDPAHLLISALSELLIGSVIGLTVRVTLGAAEAAGTLAGNAMGLGFANQVDPLFHSEGVPTTSLVSSLAVVIFFVLRGHHTVIEALSASLTIAPCGQGFPTFQAHHLLTLGTRIVAQGLRIASPVVATMFIVQLGTALVARAAPRVQVFALSFGVSVTLGALVLVVSAPQLAQGLATTISTIPDTLAQMLSGGAR
ncbi:MAG: flagellar biosynthetic protein FliR [Myxococcaceae bacterium]|nr:flagellar biosynthetic protein FliR [Myxococcaceae bacterium]